GQTSTATETITISVADPAPVATAGSTSTDEDHVKTGTLNYTLGDADDGGHLTTGTFTTARGGSVTINSDGTFSYDPTHVTAFETLPAGQTTTDTFSFTVTDSHGQTSTATETITITGDLPPQPINLSETAVSDFNGGFFANGNTGNLQVNATFPAHAASEVQTIDIKLAAGFTAVGLNASGSSWTDTHIGHTYNFAYTYNSATGDIVVTIPGGASATDNALTLNFDIKAPATNTPGNLVFTETVTTSPAGDLVDGAIPVASGGDMQSASFSTGIPSAHLLSGTVTTNTNVNHQEVVVSFIDKNSPLDAMAFIMDTNATGQQGNITNDAGFNISPTDHFLVGLDEPFVTSKVQVTNFTLNGITMTEPNPSNHIVLTANDAQGGVHGYSADITLNGSTSVVGHDSIDSSFPLLGSGPTPTNPDFLYGSGTSQFITGASTSDFLAANASAGSDLIGNGGTDVFIYTPGTGASANSYTGSATGFDILRVDDGAIYNTSLEDAGASRPSWVLAANADTVGSTHLYVEDLSGALLGNINEILVTQEAAVLSFNPALYGTELVGLSVSNITSATDASTTLNDFKNGSGNTPTSETWNHALFVAGSSGDDVQLSLNQSGGWTDTHTTLTTSSGKVYEHYVPTGTTGTPLANLFIDNVLHVNAGTHAA
ncbi:MAG: hypothetical protein QOF07_1331, partial [Bradyrhizobium sp.]|nr:hypothetical protein [Bradyrhizobium sp.]